MVVCSNGGDCSNGETASAKFSSLDFGYQAFASPRLVRGMRFFWCLMLALSECAEEA
jgi:hypothetical protein